MVQAGHLALSSLTGAQDAPGSLELAHDRLGAVGRAVAHHENLQSLLRVVEAQAVLDLPADHTLFVVCRNHQSDGGQLSPRPVARAITSDHAQKEKAQRIAGVSLENDEGRVQKQRGHVLDGKRTVLIVPTMSPMSYISPACSTYRRLIASFLGRTALSEYASL